VSRSSVAATSAAGVLLPVLLATALPIARATADPDLAAGQHWLKLACGECHTLGNVIDGKGAPDLDGVVGRRAAATGYDYSDAMKAAAAKGLTWTPQNLDPFIADPRGFLPGTGMEIYGLIHESDRQNVLAVLEQYSPDYKPEAPAPAR